MSRLGAGDGLARALCMAFGGSDVVASAETLANRSWTSITFSGERHALRLTIEGEGAGAAADAFLAGLAEAELALPGHHLVDLGMVGDDRTADGCRVVLDLEAVTVEVR